MNRGEEKRAARIVDELFCFIWFVKASIVHNDDLSWLKLWNKSPYNDPHKIEQLQEEWFVPKLVKRSESNEEQNEESAAQSTI